MGRPGPGSVWEGGGHGGPLQDSLASGTAGAGASWAVGLGHTGLLNLSKSQGPAGVSGEEAPRGQGLARGFLPWANVPLWPRNSRLLALQPCPGHWVRPS